MASLPCFILSPSTILSIGGLLHGPDRTPPTPVGDWRTAKVDVVIPALNEADHIEMCLASVLRQTLRPRQVVLIDDGSTDGTVERAKAYCEAHNLPLTAVQRRSPIGKTPTIKRQARELDSDVEFILDADTVLESDNYIARTVEELYQAHGIASAFGTIQPQRKKDRQAFEERAGLREPGTEAKNDAGLMHDVARGATNMYRDVLYMFLQRFIYRGQMVFFGTTNSPIGCAVAYRRKYVEALFDHIEPELGDDLTNSEDIFIGFSMLNEGYRNIQLTDVYARTVEPEIQRLPRQLYFWSSSFLQSCYYFDPLVRSPFKALKRWRAQRRQDKSTRNGTGAKAVRHRVDAPASVAAMSMAGGAASLSLQLPMQSRAAASMMSATALSSQSMPASIGGQTAPSGPERRVVTEPYRQAFGRARTESLGRPSGWIPFMAAVEKVFFPTTLLIMAILGNWTGLAWTIAIETLLCVSALALVMPGQRMEYVAKGLLTTPIRYALLGGELVTLGRFATDLWITKNRKWRK